MLLAACGGAPPAAQPTAAEAQPTAAEAQPTAAAEAQPTAAEAQPTAAAAMEPVELTYTYLTFSGIPQDLQTVQDAMNVILKEKINATIKLEVLDGAKYDETMKLRFASGENMDIVFTANWVNNYYQNIAQGNLLPLDELLQTYAPNTYASLPPATWEAARVNGDIYGVINQQIFVRPQGTLIRKDLADKYELDLTAINTPADLELFMQQVIDGEADVTPLLPKPLWGNDYLSFFGWDAVAYPVAIDANSDELRAFNVYDTPEFEEVVALTRTWYEAGYYPREAPQDFAAAFKAGQFAMYPPTEVIKPGAESEYKASLGFDFVAKQLSEPLLTTGGIVATMNGISRTSQNPERAMMFLELLNTDPTVYNLLAKGVKDTHWVWVDEANQIIGFPEGVTAETTGYNPTTDWMFGNQFNAYYTNEAQVGSWETTKELNDTAKVSPALGFSFSPDAVKTELAQVDAVVKQYGAPIFAGQIDPATAIPEFREQLKAAGIDAVVAEVQKQLDAWKATK
jgi:putative aldouronate transport system substrate-binding protein